MIYREVIMAMTDKIKEKLHHNSGESIGETLIALLVGSLALMMLAGTISTSTRLITSSKTSLRDHYTANNLVAEHSTEEEIADYDVIPSGKITITETDDYIKKIASQTFDVNYYVNQHTSGKPIISYEKTTS